MSSPYRSHVLRKVPFGEKEISFTPGAGSCTSGAAVAASRISTLTPSAYVSEAFELTERVRTHWDAAAKAYRLPSAL